MVVQDGGAIDQTKIGTMTFNAMATFVSNVGDEVCAPLLHTSISKCRALKHRRYTVCRQRFVRQVP